jgi:hypothetical protein
MQRLGAKIGRHSMSGTACFCELADEAETTVLAYDWSAPGAPSLKGSYRRRDVLSDEQLAADGAGKPYDRE